MDKNQINSLPITRNNMSILHRTQTDMSNFMMLKVFNQLNTIDTFNVFTKLKCSVCIKEHFLPAYD